MVSIFIFSTNVAKWTFIAYHAVRLHSSPN